jgi:hypothetical protein
MHTYTYIYIKIHINSLTVFVHHIKAETIHYTRDIVITRKRATIVATKTVLTFVYIYICINISYM